MSKSDFSYLEGRAAQDFIEQQLSKINNAEESGTVLYTNRDGSEYWELSFPETEYHGSGIPLLQRIDEREARKKYRF